MAEQYPKTVNYTLNTVFAENNFQNSIVNNGSFVVSTTNQAFSLVGLNANKRYWIRKENAESQDYLTNMGMRKMLLLMMPMEILRNKFKI